MQVYEPILSCTLDLAGESFDFAALPDAPGVLVVEGDSGATAFVAVTSRLRQAAQVRLGAQETGHRSPRADLRPIARRVLACTVGSRFEANAAYLALCRIRRPADHRAAIERWQGWFLRIDPGAEHPRWSKVCMPGWSAASEGPASVSHRRLVGPFRDKHVAGRFADALDDLFDLCRHLHILAQAPHGRACAYKEMGRCPAACDGSETMDAYRARVGQALGFASNDRSEAVARRERAMLALAEGMQFEAAAHEKRRLDLARTLSTAAFERVRSLDAFRWIIVAPAEKRGWARLFAAAAGRLVRVADVDGADAESGVGRAWGDLEVAAWAAATDTFSELEQETIGLLCSHLLAPGARTARAEAFIRAEDPATARSAVVEAVSRLGRRWRKADLPFDEESLPAADWTGAGAPGGPA